LRQLLKFLFILEGIIHDLPLESGAIINSLGYSVVKRIEINNFLFLICLLIAMSQLIFIQGTKDPDDPSKILPGGHN